MVESIAEDRGSHREGVMPSLVVDTLHGTDTELIVSAPDEPTGASCPAAPPVIAVVVRQPVELRWLQNRAIVVAILLTCGPLGLPALWLCSRFSKAAKIATTVVFLLATVVFPIALTWYWLDFALRPLVDALDSGGK